MIYLVQYSPGSCGEMNIVLHVLRGKLKHHIDRKMLIIVLSYDRIS